MATKDISVIRSLTPDQPHGHLHTEAWAEAATVLLSIKAKRAYDISWCSAFQGHEEVLFRANTPFTVCGGGQLGRVRSGAFEGWSGKGASCDWPVQALVMTHHRRCEVARKKFFHKSSPRETVS